MTRVCSLLPSATEIVADLGMIDSLVGVSNECRWPPEVVGLPIVTSARLDPARLDQPRDRPAGARRVSDGRSLYTVDAELIDTLKPDVIVTQDLCAVCAVSSGELRSICPVDARMVSLDPGTLAEVADIGRRRSQACSESRAPSGRWSSDVADDRRGASRRWPGGRGGRGGGSSSPSGSTRRSAPGTGCPG